MGSSSSGSRPRERASGRVALVDVARGAALVAMAVYHFVWDLGALQITAENLALTTPGKIAARMIAGAFLFLVGVGLVLGHGDGMRWRGYLRRLALIGGAALAVTVATRIATPEGYIFFGILHCIALSSILALPFLRAPVPVPLGAAVLVIALPAFVEGGIFDAPELAWLGLASAPPETNDFVPIVPWFAAVLLGIAAARFLRAWLAAQRHGVQRPGNRTARALTFAGRHSLLVYLVHQPLMLAILYPAALALGPSSAASTSSFRHACERGCAEGGRSAPTCARICACTARRLREAGLWNTGRSPALADLDRERIAALARQCATETGAAERRG